MMRDKAFRAPEVRYGWAIVFACMAGLIVAISPIFWNTLPVFIGQITADTGWTRSHVMLGVAASTLAVVISSPFIGRLVDTFGPRLVIGCAAPLFALCFMALPLTTGSYSVFLFVCALIGLFGNAFNTFVYLSFIPRWFNARLGLALGLASAGSGIGQAINPAIAHTLLLHFGWRSSFAILALVSLAVTMLLVMLVLRDGSRTTSHDAPRPADPRLLDGVTLRTAAATPDLWVMALAFCCITTAASGTMFSMVPLMTDRGVAASDAVRIVGLAGLSLMVARLVTGFLLDRVSVKIIGTTSFLGATFGLSMLVSGGGLQSYAIAVLLLGAAMGVEGDLMAFLVRRMYGRRHYSSIYGVLWAAFSAGTLIGPLLMSQTFDRYGSYMPMLEIFIGLTIVATVSIAIVRIRPRYSGPDHDLARGPTEIISAS